jgi:hypothetical protein
MRNEIAEKLNKHIKAGVASEKDIVYLMVEVRKILEHTKSVVGKYPILAFYTNWIVHTRLTKPHPGRKEILQNANVVAFLSRMRFDKDSETFIKRHHIPKAISFLPLRGEMQSFLIENGIATDVVDNENWRSFTLLLIEVLIDSPLEDVENEFSSIKAFSFVKEPNSADQGDGKAVAYWKLVCKNGVILEGPVRL